MPDFHLEDIALGRVTYPDVIAVGLDEVGTGAWAGPIVAAAVSLPREDVFSFYSELDDSKRCSKTKRERLEPKIRAAAQFIGLGVVTTREVNEMGVGRAREVALERAYFQVLASAHVPLVAVVDGRSLRKLRTVFGQYTIFADRADQKSLNVAAASIVAKVTRDHMMMILDATNPGYQFRTNVGYGTRQHIAALRQLGPCEIHRVCIKPVRALVNDSVVIESA